MTIGIIAVCRKGRQRNCFGARRQSEPGPRGRGSRAGVVVAATALWLDPALIPYEKATKGENQSGVALSLPPHSKIKSAQIPANYYCYAS